MENHIAFPAIGFDITINRVAVSIGPLNIYWYGLIIVAGFMLAIWYCVRQAPKYGIRQEDLIDLALIATPAAIIGARLYYVVFNWSEFKDNLVSVLYIWEGGIAIYGAIIFGALTMFWFGKRKKLPIFNILDLAILGVMIGQIVGRWGNFVNAEAYGVEVSGWFLGMSINGGATVHPNFLYESLWNLAGFLLLHFVFSKRRRFYGQTFVMYILWYGTGRGIIEGIRGEDTLMLFNTGLRVSQILGFLSALVAAGILIYKLIFSDRSDTIRLRTKEDLMEEAALREAEALLAAEQAETDDHAADADAREELDALDAQEEQDALDAAEELDMLDAPAERGEDDCAEAETENSGADNSGTTGAE